MAEAAPQPPKAPKGIVVLLLVLLVLGTLVLVGWSLWQFLEHENRGDGLLYLSLGIMWFMFVSWRIRWLTHTRPQ